MEVTEDSIYSAAISLLQPRHGYRFGIDSVLLAHFLKTSAYDDVLEIGAGTGVISILLDRLSSFHSLTAIEIQEELARLCRQNFEKNRVKNAVVHQADARTLEKVLQGTRFDLIFSNPPYRKISTGRLSSDRQRRIARHEVLLSLQDLFHCASKFLNPSGRLSLILPVYREKDLLQMIHSGNWYWRDRQYVHSFASGPPVFLMSTLTREEAPKCELPPQIIYTSSGKYTDRVQRMIG